MSNTKYKTIAISKRNVEVLDNHLNEGWTVYNTMVVPGVAHGGNAWDEQAEIHLSYCLVVLSRPRTIREKEDI